MHLFEKGAEESNKIKDKICQKIFQHKCYLYDGAVFFNIILIRG